jgi:hypothetical protein
MALTVDTVLLGIAVILMVVSAFNVNSPLELWKLAWAFVIASLIF